MHRMSIPHIVLGSIEWLAGFAFIVLASLAVWFHFRFHRRPIDLALLLFLCLFNTIFFMFLMGITALLERSIVSAVSFLASLSLLICFRKNYLSVYLEVNDVILEAKRRAVHHPRTTALLCITVILIGLRMFAHVWFLSPYIWDTLSYHLPKVADWIQYKELVALPTPVTRSYWAANFELFQAWFVLFFHHDFLIEAAGLPFYVLAVLSVYSSSRSLDMSRRWSAFIAGIYALTPSVLMNAVSCKNDIAIAALYLFIVAILMDYGKNRDYFLSHFVIAVVVIFLATGIKPYIIFILPGIAWIGLQYTSRSGAHPSGTSMRGNRLTVSVLLLTASVLLCIYWYARSYAMFDNPFHPVDFRLFGHLVFGDGHGAGQQGTFDMGTSWLSLRDLIGRRIFDLRAYEADLPGISGWGWFVFSCGLPASMLALIRYSEFRWLACGFFISLVCLLGMVDPDPWHMRFTQWFPAILVTGYGMVTSRMRVAPVRWGLIVLAVCCSMLNYIGSLDTGYSFTKDWGKIRAVSVWQRNSALLVGRESADSELVPSGEKIAYHAYANSWIYPLYGSDYSRRVHYLTSDRTDVVNDMKRIQARYLLLIDRPAEWKRLIELHEKQGRLIRLTDNLYFRPETLFR